MEKADAAKEYEPWTATEIEEWCRNTLDYEGHRSSDNRFSVDLNFIRGVLVMAGTMHQLRRDAADVDAAQDYGAMGHEHAEMIQSSGDVLRVGETCGRAIERLRRVMEAMK